jgi:hypothetical protein
MMGMIERGIDSIVTAVMERLDYGQEWKAME